MARKPNFNYEKNRREQDKKKKREEKRLRKQGRSDSGDGTTEFGSPDAPANDDATPGAPSSDSASPEPVK